MLRTAACLPNCKLIIHSGVSHAIPMVEDAADDAEVEEALTEELRGEDSE